MTKAEGIFAKTIYKAEACLALGQWGITGAIKRGGDPFRE